VRRRADERPHAARRVASTLLVWNGVVTRLPGSGDPEPDPAGTPRSRWDGTGRRTARDRERDPPAEPQMGC